MKKSVEEIAGEDGRFDPKSLRFVFDALGEAIQQTKGSEAEATDNPAEPGPHHITGAELSTALAHLAQDKWGFLAKMVLRCWGVFTTRDIGEIVYLMISHGWMTAQATDSIDDFDGVYDFEDVFEKQFCFEVT